MRNFIFFFITITLISCSSPTNSPEFISKTEGRYLYNPDEIIEVYFNNEELYIKWRGATALKPLKTNENIFFLKEMNEKIQFKEVDNQYVMYIAPKKNDTIEKYFRKLNSSEKIPSEYLAEGDFNKALEGYKTIQNKDSLNNSIKEDLFNSLGYKKLREKNYEEALAIFKINMALYPNSSNVYDSYADALKRNGDTIQAIEYYKKSLELDSGNKYAKRFIEKYGHKK